MNLLRPSYTQRESAPYGPLYNNPLYFVNKFSYFTENTEIKSYETYKKSYKRAWQ